MKNKKMITLILFLLTINLFCLDIKEYDIELVKFLKTEQGNKELLIYSEGVLPPGPQCFTISEDGYIYVCDIWNERIAVYDLNLIYIKEIKSLEKQMTILFADNIKLDNNKNIYLNLDKRKIVKFNQKGNIVYTIKDIEIKRDIFSLDNYYPINNDLFFYDENKRIRAVDKQGKILNIEESKQMINIIKVTTRNNSEDSNANRLERFIDENNLLDIDGKLLNNDFSVHREYYSLKKDLYKAKSLNKEINIDFSNYYYYRIIGYDKDTNAYWKAYWKDKNYIKEIILIFSINGNLIDVFYNNLSHSIQVAPNGDLYGMVLGNGGVTFNKITRKW